MERYTIERELGAGAFGTVYAARDAESGRLVALKQLSRLSPAALSRFKQEFRAVQGLSHPHIVRLDALIEHESGWLIAMELVEGSDLLSYVKQSDNDPTFDEDKVRTAFRQLAEALSGLHEHGILHRDLKPANVRVGADGRVVLLDFGLVTSVSSEAQSTHHDASGTAAYMAPEQAAGAKVLTEAADWYAFGACLYEALTGSLPFIAESPLAVMLAKQGKSPERPSDRVGFAIASDLEALCMRLLAPDPKDRPGIVEVRQTLGRSEPVTGSFAASELTGSFSAGDLDTSEPFEGREAELVRITRAHAAARAEGLRMLLVEAESGMGKTTLVTEWLTRLKQREPGALILKSRCYENEHSAFKAFDAGMESLARRLRTLEGKDGQLLVPPHAALLRKLFPALASVRALKNAPLFDIPADPGSALRCGLIALATLLKLLSGSGSVVLVIDDLQWADPESFRLLRTLSEAAHAPRLLVLATVRPESELDADVASELALLGTRLQLERLPLLGLSKASCERLACHLLTGSVMAGWLERIATESKGHPMFVSVLSRFMVSRRPSTSAELSLEAAMAEKLNSLDDQGRTLVELLALAAQPCSLGLVARALDVDAEQTQKCAAALVSAKVLRRLPHQQLACFHDLVRSVVVTTLSEGRKRALHRALANAIVSSTDHDPAFLAVHLEGAGEALAALAAHQRAGELALTALSFGKAEHHYARALALAIAVGADPALTTALRVNRGHALARAGRSAPAAQQYLDACEDADPAQRVQLRVWAAQHLLQSAQIEAGLTAAREVLSELGVPLPRAEGTAIARLAWDRLCLGFTGLEPRAETPIHPAERAKLDAMWNLGMPISMVELMAGATLGTRHLRSSLAAGDRAHVARALASEASVAAMQNPAVGDRPEKLIQRARTLYEGDQNPGLEAWVLLCEGVVASFRSENAPMCEKLARAEALLRTRCPEEPWLLTQVRSVLALGWFQSGQFGHHQETLEHWVAEATERQDPFAIASLDAGGLSALRFLLCAKPECAQRRIREATASWPREPFSIMHLGELSALQYAARYAGGDQALIHLEEERARHRRAFLLRSGFGKGLLSAHWAQACLGAYCAMPGFQSGHHLRRARDESRALYRSNVPFARLTSMLIAPQLAAIEGETGRALALTGTAALEAARLGHGLMEAPLGYLEGLLLGGDEGREKRAQALALGAAQGWKDPRRLVAMHCPVADYLEAKPR